MQVDTERRKKAEKEVSLRPNIMEEMTPEETRLILHELQVHQIELEMQNEELRHTQEELAAAKARYFDLYNLAPVGYVTMSENGLILEANLTAASLLGVSRGALLKQPLSRFIYPEDQDIYYLHRKELIETGITKSCELRMVDNPHQQFFWALLHLTPAANHEYRLTLCDISERKRLEAQLRQSQKMEVIGTLAGGIAHDFNNILTAILGFSGMVMDGLPSDSPLRELQTQVIKGGERAAELVKQILAFSRKTEQHAAPMLIQPIVKEALKLLRASLSASIEIKQDIDVNLGPVTADPIQIHQLLMNLCTNAKQAMSGSGGIMSVSLKPVSLSAAEAAGLDNLRAGRYAVLEVSDTGCGMSKEVQERIFEPYFTTKGTGEGTGLGLAVVHGIATVMGGAVSVASTLGQGTTFRVYLPLPEHGIASTPLLAESLPQGGNESVLVVDDEEAIATLEGTILLNLGYKVTKFTDSELAWQAFRAAPDSFDLLVTDMAMPRRNGVALAKEVMHLRPGLPVILCTGYSELIDQEKAKALGIKAFLEKPLGKGQLARVVRMALDGASDLEDKSGL